MNIKFFDLARKVAKLSDHKRFNLGSVVVSGSKIISVGANKLKTHPKSKHPFRSLHSEMAAILSARQNLYNCDLYVYRETKSGELAKSLPCVYCQEMIQEAGIKNVFYTGKNSYETMKVRE